MVASFAVFIIGMVIYAVGFWPAMLIIFISIFAVWVFDTGMGMLSGHDE